MHEAGIDKVLLSFSESDRRKIAYDNASVLYKL